VDGGESVTLCWNYCLLNWDTTGKFLYVHIQPQSEKSYALPVQKGSGLPQLPPAGIAGIEDMTNDKNVVVLPQYVEAALSPSAYVYSRKNVRRNLYRIQLQ
jgi:hypothetical protein